MKNDDVKIPRRVLSPNVYIPFLKGRPVRTVQISKDEVVDLKIVLNTCDSVTQTVCKI